MDRLTLVCQLLYLPVQPTHSLNLYSMVTWNLVWLWDWIRRYFIAELQISNPSIGWSPDTTNELFKQLHLPREPGVSIYPLSHSRFL